MSGSFLSSIAVLSGPLVEILEKGIALAGAEGEKEAATGLGVLRDELRAPRFQIAVVGLEKRGKSSLVNALFGRKLLPARGRPATNVIAYVEPAADDDFAVYMREGTVKRVRAEELELYATAVGNPENRLGVSHLHLRVESSLLPSGVVLVDTPGGNALSAEHDRIVHELLPTVPAVIFVLTASKPLTLPEKELLSKVLAAGRNKLFLVANRMDDFENAEERAAALEFLRKMLASEMGLEKPRIFPVSSAQQLDLALGRLPAGTETGFPQLLEALDGFLSQESGPALLKFRASQAREQLDLLDRTLRVRLAALRLDRRKLEERVPEVKQLEETGLREAENVTRLAGIKLKDLRFDIVKRLEREAGDWHQEARDWIARRVKEELDRGGRLKLADFLNEAKKALPEMLEKRSAAWLAQENRALDRELGTIVSETKEEFRKILNRYFEKVGKTFGEKLAPLARTTLSAETEKLRMALDLRAQSFGVRIADILFFSFMSKGRDNLLDKLLELAKYWIAKPIAKAAMDSALGHLDRKMRDAMLEQLDESIHKSLTSGIETLEDRLQKELESALQPALVELEDECKSQLQRIRATLEHARDQLSREGPQLADSIRGAETARKELTRLFAPLDRMLAEPAVR